MQQVIVELDDETLRRLDQVAPARARKRSEFIREAIRRALNERLEEAMEQAYRAQPQDEAEVDLDPSTWAPARRRPRRGARR
jgi:predicted transcriptional regulator